MSLTYLAVFDDAEFRVTADTLRAALERGWPGLTFEPGQPAAASQVRDVVWAYQRGADLIAGHSHIDGTCIYLEGSVALAAEFAVWYRTLVPPAIDLVFCDEGYTFAAAVLPESTVAELVAQAEEGR